MGNIIITSAGRRVSLVKYFQKELHSIFGPTAKVYTTDLNPSLAPACRISNGSFKTGSFAEENYIDSLLTLCMANNISLIIPTIDPELQLMAKHINIFNDNSISVVISDMSFINNCRNKRKTNLFFTQNKIQIPRSISKDNLTFPLFIKPIDGSSSKNLYIIHNEDQISTHLYNNKKLLWMEYLDPKEFSEYTVDMYYDRNSHLKCSVPRVRISTRDGETNKGLTYKDPIILNFLEDRLAYIDGARGCITLQLFKSKSSDEIFGIEINPRFGGGYPLAYLAGANYPKWIIEEYLQDKTVSRFDNWDSNKLLLRYDHEMTIDNYNYLQ